MLDNISLRERAKISGQNMAFSGRGIELTWNNDNIINDPKTNDTSSLLGKDKSNSKFLGFLSKKSLVCGVMTFIAAIVATMYLQRINIDETAIFISWLSASLISGFFILPVYITNELSKLRSLFLALLGGIIVTIISLVITSSILVIASAENGFIAALMDMFVTLSLSIIIFGPVAVIAMTIGAFFSWLFCYRFSL